jgi:hypothetical protein
MIPKTYYDDNPEARAHTRDFWSWLKLQPQDAWLLYARVANWDNADWIFGPSCDRAVISWIFWGSDPGFLVGNPDQYRPDSLIAKIVTNVARGYYKRAELYYNRFEVVHHAQSYVRALATAGAAPFRLPRELCGPFDGRRARLPSRYDEETERDLFEIFTAIDGALPRSEEDHWKRQEQGGNLWIKELFALPAVPAEPLESLRHLDDARYVEAIFGRRRAYLRAREKYVGRPRGKTLSLVLILLGVFAVVAIGGALIAHRIRTGTW